MPSSPRRFPHDGRLKNSTTPALSLATTTAKHSPTFISKMSQDGERRRSWSRRTRRAGSRRMLLNSRTFEAHHGDRKMRIQHSYSACRADCRFYLMARYCEGRGGALSNCYLKKNRQIAPEVSDRRGWMQNTPSPLNLQFRIVSYETILRDGVGLDVEPNLPTQCFKRHANGSESWRHAFP